MDSFTVVEFPANVCDEAARERAIEKLGGLENITKVAQAGKGDSKLLELRFRPTSSPIYGEADNNSNALVAVVRRKVKRRVWQRAQADGTIERRVGEVMEQNGATECTILGPVRKHFTFTGLADFQYLPPVREKQKENRSTGQGESLYMPPPLFTKVDIPQPIMSKLHTKEPERKHTEKLQSQAADFHCAAVPEAPTPSQQPSREVEPVEAKLKKLFEERPVWSRAALEGELGADQTSQLKRLLPRVSYFFANGPWRQLWVRFGYDPRKDFGSRIYQSFDFRVPRELLKKVAEANSTPTGGKAYRFESIPVHRQALYQLLDLNGEAFQMLVNVDIPEDQRQLNEKFGWYPPRILDQLRALLKEKLHRMLGEDGRTEEETTLSVAQYLQERSWEKEDVGEQQPKKKRRKGAKKDILDEIQDMDMEGTRVGLAKLAEAAKDVEPPPEIYLPRRVDEEDHYEEEDEYHILDDDDEEEEEEEDMSDYDG